MRIRTFAIPLATGMLAIGLGIGTAGVARADVPPPSPTWNEIFVPFDNQHGNTMCVDVPNGSTGVNVALQFFHCHGYDSNGGPQRWHFIPVDTNPLGTEYLIQNVNSGLCIGRTFTTDPQFSLTSGTRLAQQPCDEGGQVLTWTLHVQNANGTDPLMQLIAGLSNLCMTPSDMSDNNHTPMQVTTCQGFANPPEILELG